MRFHMQGMFTREVLLNHPGDLVVDELSMLLLGAGYHAHADVSILISGKFLQMIS